ncbi:cellulase [candidate division KSB1 bacterium]|nr:cellulase [candidate division KSB1 bacterium]
MYRRTFLHKTIASVSSLFLLPRNQVTRSKVVTIQQETDKETDGIKKTTKYSPRAITMWDFSWLERRWPGAGYEDWDKVLDELVERGYNAVRIDAYPHLIANNPARQYTLLPVWDQQMWGSPAVNKVFVQPFLNRFIATCKEKDIKVGLSSWFREDSDNVRMKITSAAKMAEIWLKTLASIAKDNLLDAVLYVDLCNEWPGDLWAPYFKNDPPELTWTYWHTAKSMQFMKESIEAVKKEYPELPYCYSFTGGMPEYYISKDLSFFDLLEHHTWMAQLNKDEYYKKVGYEYDRFSPDSYKNLVENYEKVYNERPDYWKLKLTMEIERVAKAAGSAKLPLITTECWGLVDFKDWPLLKWDIIKELCALGTLTAAKTGQWAAIATSNFCGPQFVGMWQDVRWHQNLTTQIKAAPMSEDLANDERAQKLLNRLAVAEPEEEAEAGQEG